ncbi:acetyltransferase (GNAT) family protein [Fontibacillus phaseoli]|uniref:Acetyltransferase (GNAT) family protein n=1 Tax=Fontibacillus phaseoli TaxID=1416533 RepID=A0A369AX75_9BACL|nr:GNAT family N-acetyltransferase [Fontibacillus phaseoli]RCX14000.1 acetyltransferase (GNAT) family protein [Fontibacillus phaseoli]
MSMDAGQEITIRPMNSQEAKEVQRLGRRAFMGLESLFVSKPKDAVVALVGNRIVGAIIMKFLKGDRGQTIGDFSAGFVDCDYRDSGIGGRLYKAATNHFWERGCDYITAEVKDDNVGSWRLLEKNGYMRTEMIENFSHLRGKGMASLLFGTPVPYACGMDFYLASKKNPIKEKTAPSAVQVVIFLLLNLLLSCTILILNHQIQLTWFMLAYGILMLGDVFFTRIGAGFGKRKWQYRMTNCGFLISLLIPLLGTVFPMIGNWMPRQYESTPKLRKELGISALAGWAFIVILVVFTGLVTERHIFVNYLNSLGSMLLLYRIIPVYPFGAFGSLRVYRMNKFIYAVMAVASLLVLFLID